MPEKVKNKFLYYQKKAVSIQFNSKMKIMITSWKLWLKKMKKVSQKIKKIVHKTIVEKKEKSFIYLFFFLEKLRKKKGKMYKKKNKKLRKKKSIIKVKISAQYA